MALRVIEHRLSRPILGDRHGRAARHGSVEALGVADRPGRQQAGPHGDHRVKPRPDELGRDAAERVGRPDGAAAGRQDGEPHPAPLEHLRQNIGRHGVEPSVVVLERQPPLAPPVLAHVEGAVTVEVDDLNRGEDRVGQAAAKVAQSRRAEQLDRDPASPGRPAQFVEQFTGHSPRVNQVRPLGSRRDQEDPQWRLERHGQRGEVRLGQTPHDRDRVAGPQREETLAVVEQLPWQGENLGRLPDHAELVSRTGVQLPGLDDPCGPRPERRLEEPLSDQGEPILDAAGPLELIIVRPHGVLLEIPQQVLAVLRRERVGQDPPRSRHPQRVAADRHRGQASGRRPLGGWGQVDSQVEHVAHGVTPPGDPGTGVGLRRSTRMRTAGSPSTM